MREKLLRAGVKNLREFGYPGVTDKNIISDDLYRAFFRRMLEENLGRGADAHVKLLLAECDAADAKAKP
jgi:hypothetical protein